MAPGKGHFPIFLILSLPKDARSNCSELGRTMGERRSHFEVHIFVDERWLLDGIFFAREDAVEDARTLLGSRHQLDAVRVLQVQEEETGFVEWTVFVAARPQAEGRHSHIEASWLIERAALARPAPIRRSPPTPAPQSRPALLLATVLALVALIMVASYRPPSKNDVWIFDRPEAWQPHAVHSPWTGNQ